MGFDDVPFPLPLARGSSGGPVFSTTIVESASGREWRNQNRASARLRFNAARAVRSAAERDLLLAFFYARRGRARAFPLRDWADFKSCGSAETPEPGDQVLGLGDGQIAAFQLVKWYGAAGGEQGGLGYARRITKPLVASVRVALDGVEQQQGWSVSRESGVVAFAQPPEVGVTVSAGFLFDVPVRFELDQLEVAWLAPGGQEIGEVPLVEVFET